MKIKFRTVAGATFQLGLEPDSTVLAVKEAIEQARPELPAYSLKLIHNGKILQDGSTLAASGISESGFVVVMSMKVKKPAAAPSASPAGAAETGASSSSSVVPAAVEVAPAPAPTAAPAAGAQAADAVPAPDLTAEQESERRARFYAELGFPEEDVRRALQAASQDPKRAITYLMRGIPAGLDRGPDGAGAASTPGAGTSSNPVAFGAPGASQEIPALLQFIKDSEQFRALRVVLNRDPSALRPMLVGLREIQPKFYSFFMRHRVDFMRLLCQMDEANDPTLAQAVRQLARDAAAVSEPGVTERSLDESALDPEGLAAPGQLARRGEDDLDELERLEWSEQERYKQIILAEELERVAALAEAQERGALREGQGGHGHEASMEEGEEGPDMGEGEVSEEDDMGEGEEGADGEQVIIRLTREERDAVQRLAEMGAGNFSIEQCLEAYIACGKNEELAANVLWESL